MKFDNKKLKLTEELSISRDIAGFVEEIDKQIPVFLFVPKDLNPSMRPGSEHHHIELTKETALALKDWLDDYLLDMEKPCGKALKPDMADFKHPDWVIEELKKGKCD